MERDDCNTLRDQVIDAIAAKQTLRISGGGSKCFMLGEGEKVVLSVAEHRGITAYNPTEMVLTARAGTSVAEIENTLHERGQMLPSESPAFDAKATLGGTVASAFCGPRAPFAGSLRDIVLGCKMLNGKGEVLSFGGQVLKNVAGYDISRLLVGSYGILGVILEVSFKVLPKPAAEITLAFEKASLQQALAFSNKLIHTALPVSAACYHEGMLLVRISGNETTVQNVRVELGGETVSNDFWSRLGNLKLPFFADDTLPLWRLNLPAATPELALEGSWLSDWNGAQRWYRGLESAEQLRQQCHAAGGQATCFRRIESNSGGSDPVATFQPLESHLMAWHQQLKAAFDPHGLFNTNLMYAGL